jgi:hypothetical protein
MDQNTLISTPSTSARSGNGSPPRSSPSRNYRRRGRGFHGVVDITLPKGCHAELIETIAATDDTLLERYLNGEEISARRAMS